MSVRGAWQSARRASCPIHGPHLVGRHINGGSSLVWRRAFHKFSQGELKQLLPTMNDLGLYRNAPVTVAMSGGVDSSVALRILADMPLRLSVVYMRNWDPLLAETPDFEDDANPAGPAILDLNYAKSKKKKGKVSHQCSWERDWADVREVCRHVGVPGVNVRLVDLSKEYWSRVFEPSIQEWERGGTPNPDVGCNREIKFGALLDPVRRVTVEERVHLATGHYARIMRKPHAIRLCRAKDSTKDQSYYLSSITEAQLRTAVLPLANLTKTRVRQLARFYGLPNAEREESMGICFVGERQRFGDFISQYVSKPAQQGYLVTPDGKRVGEHEGLWYYTIGQRARVGGMVEPHFVAKKGVGASGQDILVVPGSDHPALQCVQVKTKDFSWIAGKVPKGLAPGSRKACHVQVRHRMVPVKGRAAINWDGQGVLVDFPEPITGVAPGQVVALWYQNWCLGSGVIRETKTLDELPEDEREAVVKRMERAKAKRAAGQASSETNETSEGDEVVENEDSPAEVAGEVGALADSAREAAVAATA